MTEPDSPVADRWRWVHVGVAALAMVATLPGRTHGLGLFTEPILQSFPTDRESYGFLNLWATLLGALFCLPCGWLIDRLGTRVVYAGVTGLLGATVLVMSRATGDRPSAVGIEGLFAVQLFLNLFLFVLLTRGFGQSALSVVSLSLMGRSAGGKSGVATAVYSCVTTLGFMAAFAVVGQVVKANPGEWRGPWAGIGIGVLAAGFVGGLLIRPGELAGRTDRARGESEASFTLSAAIRTRTFWAFALGVSFYGLVVAGTSLFNESILNERGFGKDVFVNVTYVGIPVGLLANLGGGLLAGYISLGRILAAGLALFAGVLAWFPIVQTEPAVYAYAVGLAAAGGWITVAFFTVWRRAFGPTHLGRIQGVAQLFTVVASGFGQYLFGAVKTRFGEYEPLFFPFAVVAAVLALFAWCTRLPEPAHAHQ